LSKTRRCFTAIAFKFALKYFIRQIQGKRGAGGGLPNGTYLLLVYAAAAAAAAAADDDDDYDLLAKTYEL
jgi:hypothetical protein